MLLRIIITTILLFGFVVLLLWASLENNKDKGMTAHSCGIDADGNSEDGGGCAMCDIKDLTNCEK